MEEVQGIPGVLPPLASFPAATVRARLPSEEWQACLDAWIFCLEFRLRLLPGHFRHFKLSDRASGLPFLLSYLQEWAYRDDPKSAYRPKHPKEPEVHRCGFFLVQRLLLETDPPYNCLPSELFLLIANGSSAFGASGHWKDALQKAWLRGKGQITAAVESCKSVLIEKLSIDGWEKTDSTCSALRQSSALAKALPEAGSLLMIGADYLDALIIGFAGVESRQKSETVKNMEQELTANLYHCLAALMNSKTPQTSVLLDHLFTLKASADQSFKKTSNNATLLSSLVCSTSFLRIFDSFVSSTSMARGEGLLTYLRGYKTQMSHVHPLPPQSRVKDRKAKSKGKGKEKDTNGNDMHIHKASQVSEIHDLFPELSNSYILRLLDHFSNDVETVVAALLEPGSLPPNLQQPDADEDEPAVMGRGAGSLTPQSTPALPVRKNVFDGDDFDNLRISSANLHIGRKEQKVLAPSNPDEHAKSKAAILSALAAFDADDDERDDTYDVADVGGTVDSTLDADTRARAQRETGKDQDDPNEGILFRAWKSDPELFARDSKTRLSQPRQQMKRETGMTDEQIEGWAVMLSRDASALGRLEKKHSVVAAFGGQQRALVGTKWQGGGSGTATEEEDSEADNGGVGQSSRGGRGRGSARSRPRGPGAQGFGRGGGNTAGPTGDQATQAARRRKEQGRGRGGANHNRREGRAKKMGRGMGPTVS